MNTMKKSADSGHEDRQPKFTINSTAPIRICDNGGWTDTWFARYGNIFHIGVSPRVSAQIAVFSGDMHREHIRIYAINYGDHYTVKVGKNWDRHPLLEASIEYMGIPEEFDYEISIFSEVPGGASTGTSAAVSVALIGALNQLRNEKMGLAEIARAAHQVETELLAQQSGIQDQICSTYGGINYIEITDYPHAQTEQLIVANEIWWELESRLALIFLGKTHSSTQIHEMVINHLENAGPDCRQLQDLRKTAPVARDAVLSGDFKALGESMINNTEAQRRLHPDLVNHQSDQIIEIAQEHGAFGWKVNGAGGNGGSLTILCDEHMDKKQSLIRAIEQDITTAKHIPIQLSRDGLRVWINKN